MSEVIRLGEFEIAFVRKAVKHVHLTVHPPTGRVTLVAPQGTRTDVARAYAISRLGWIRTQQKHLAGQARETPRQFIDRESHYLWGRRHLLTVVEEDAKPHVRLDHRRIFLHVRPGSPPEKRQELVQEWYLEHLHAVVPQLIQRWERKLGVKVSGYFLRRMKTRWGSCNHQSKTIRLNTELAKKPKDLLEYVVVHEMVHLVEPNHGERFFALLAKHYPSWQEARAELNALPLSAV